MAAAESIFNFGELKHFQKAAIEHLMKGNDVFLSVRTGAGKSPCYQAFNPMFKKENPHCLCIVLVVCPLISIMKEQKDYLSELGFSATYIGKDGKESDSIKRGEYDFLFSSPEAVVGNPEWRAMLLGPAGERVRLLVIDEAHTVLHWGESDDYDEPFRQWYGKLGELRSLIECPILLLTATANSSARKKLQQKFCMKDCHEILDNPERENIKLFLKKIKSTTPQDETFFSPLF